MKLVLVGVGGAGVSGLAYIFKDLGYDDIIGIDGAQSEITDKLKAYHINIIIGHGIYEIQPGDKIIYSEAVKNSPEVQKALQIAQDSGSQFPYPLSYFQMIGEISKHFKTLAVAGTNGKSSTTAMAIKAAVECLPEFGMGIVGAMMPDFNGKSMVINTSHDSELRKIFDHILRGDPKFDHDLYKKYLFIIEACEFNRHFLLLDVDDAVITNINLDHSDVYPTLESYIETFQQFADGVKGNLFMLESETHLLAHPRLHLLKKETLKFEHVFGEHNQKNATLVIALLEAYGDRQKIINALQSSKGIRRRMEVLGSNSNGVMIVSDYGHHPDSLKVVLQAFREHDPEKKIIAVFQPHQARRVLEFWNPFREILKQFDYATIYSIYAARESLDELKTVFSQHDLQDVESFDQLGNRFAKGVGKYTTDQEDVFSLLQQASGDQIVVVFTAGNLDYEVRKWMQKMSISN